MVGLTTLWLPILLSALFVFLASSVIHMLLRYHWSDWSRLPNEDDVRAAMNKAGVGPGNYTIPRPDTQKDLQSEAMQQKYKEGPVAFLTVLPKGVPAMGKQLILWFLYSVVVGVMVAYVAGRTVGAGAEYLQVFRVSGAVAFLAYAGAEPIASIWFGRPWSATIKTIFDGLIYALVTAGAFAWLWPE